MTDSSPPDAPHVAARSDIAQIVGARTFAFRKDKKLSRRALADAAGVSERYLQMLEKGDGNVTIQLLDRVAQALGVTVVDLIRPE